MHHRWLFGMNQVRVSVPICELVHAFKLSKSVYVYPLLTALNHSSSFSFGIRLVSASYIC